MKRPFYIFYRLAYDIFSTFSRFLNAIVFHGSTAQTTSARTHIEYTRGRWLRRRVFINALFFWQEDHCAGAWRAEVERAYHTLEKNKETLSVYPTRYA